MAYHDMNGKITIDADAAQRDIRTLQSAIEQLEQSKRDIESIQRINSGFSGAVATGIEQSSYGILKELNSEIRKAQDAINYINRTLEKYRNIDRQLQQDISNSIN